jgi:hypothetical protein
MNQHAQQEAKRDISSVNFIVTLTGLEIDTILTVVGVTTSMWAKNRRQMPGSFDLASLSSGCDKLTNPVDEDYQQRCASHSDFQSEREGLSFTSTDLLLISHDEWKRREERKHQHDHISWVTGWISGFLTSRKFVKDRIAELRQAGR